MDVRCPVCGEAIQVAEPSAGRIGRCPSCKGLYEVASAGRLRSVRSQGDEGAGVGGDADVRYKCAKCKTALESPSRLAGQQDKCPICGHSNIVPPRRKPKEPKRHREVVFPEAGNQQAGRETGASPEDREDNVFASDAMLDLQAAVGDGKVGDAYATRSVDAQEPSEVPLIVDEPGGVRTQGRHAGTGSTPPPGAPGEAQWFYVSGSEQVGPVSFAVVRDLVRAGHLQASSMIWREGMDRWAQLGTTPEFSSMPITAIPQPLPVQQWPSQYSGGPAVTPRRRAGLAVASLVCSLVGLLLFGVVLGLIGIIFGGVAFSKANQDPRAFGGKGMAVAGLIIGIVDMVLGVFWMMWMWGA